MAFLRTFVVRQTKVSESLNFKLCRLDFRVVVSNSTNIYILRVSLSEMCCASELNCASFSLSSSYLRLEPRSVHKDGSESLSYAGSFVMTLQYSRTWFSNKSIQVCGNAISPLVFRILTVIKTGLTYSRPTTVHCNLAWILMDAQGHFQRNTGDPNKFSHVYFQRS